MTPALELKAQPVRPTDDATWAALQRLADRRAPGARRAFLAAVRALGADVSLAALEQAILARDTAAVLALLPWATFQEALAAVPAAVVAAAEAAHPVAVRAAVAQLGADDALPELGPLAIDGGGARSGDLGVRFDLTSPTVREAIAARAGARITEVVEETRRAVRDVVQRAYDAGVHPRNAAKEIRRLVGLTRRQTEAVATYRRTLERPKAGAPKLSAKRVDGMVARYAAGLVKERAETIARTEMITAMAEGQQAGWAQLVADGMLDPNVYEQEWLAVMRPGRTCPRCLNMDGRRAPIGGLFEGDVRGPVTGPTLHPRCRCSVALVRRDADRPARP